MCSTWIAPSHYVRINSIFYAKKNAISVNFLRSAFFPFSFVHRFEKIPMNLDKCRFDCWKLKREKKIMGQIDWFSYYRGKNTRMVFAVVITFFFHSSDLNERKKLSITKDTGKTTQIYIYGTLQTKTHSR